MRERSLPRRHPRQIGRIAALLHLHYVVNDSGYRQLGISKTVCSPVKKLICALDMNRENGENR